MKTQKNWMDYAIRWGWIAIVLFVVIGTLIVKREEPEPDQFTLLDCFCGESKSDTRRIYSAITSGDTDAMRGLVDRGKVMLVKSGTRVYASPSRQRDELAFVLLQSGYHADKSCYIPVKFLK